MAWFPGFLWSFLSPHCFMYVILAYHHLINTLVLIRSYVRFTAVWWYSNIIVVAKPYISWCLFIWWSEHPIYYLHVTEFTVDLCYLLSIVHVVYLVIEKHVGLQYTLSMSVVRFTLIQWLELFYYVKVLHLWVHCHLGLVQFFLKLDFC